MATLDSKIPSGPLADKWRKHKTEIKLVNPANKRKYKVIVARLMDDKPMPVREKGPLFVVYPFDSAAELRTSTYYERSIWQLKALDIQ